MKKQDYTSRVSIPNCKVIWQNDNWSIELLESKDEIVVTDSWLTFYAFYDKNKNCLVWDNPWSIPPYVKIKALKLASKNMISIYN